MQFKLQPYSIHELGQRENQEDSMFPAYKQSKSEDRLFILCDGMGGHEKGEVASSTVCETMSKAILSRWNPTKPLSDELLQQALEEAYNALDAKDNGGEKKMGTTMTFLCFHAEGVTVAHIGDSRVYQLRPASKKEPARIVFKTQDHSLVNDLIKIGEITEEEAKTHPQKNVITRAMQPHQERRAKADIAHLKDIQPGDYLYMCSDGMLEQTTDENLLFIITKQGVKDTEKVEMLRKVTEENKDNHTAHLIYIEKIKQNGNINKKFQFPLAVLATLFILALGGYYFFSTLSEDDETVQDSVETKTTKRLDESASTETKHRTDSQSVNPGDGKDEEPNIKDVTPKAQQFLKMKVPQTKSPKKGEDKDKEKPAEQPQSTPEKD